MENSQVLTIILSILVPVLGVCIVGFSILIKHSKDLGIIEGALFRELKIKTSKEKKEKKK